MRQLIDLLCTAPTPDQDAPGILNAPHVIVGLRGLVTSHRSRPFNIAILTRSRVAGIQQVIQGLTEYINSTAPGDFSFTWFDGQSDEKKTMDHAFHIIKHYCMPYDAIVTVGGMPTQIAARAALLLNTKIPIIFTSIGHPSRLGIMYSGAHSNQNITGVSVHDPEYTTPVSLLQSLKKSMQSVLLPYDPQVAGVHQQIIEISRSFLSKNIHLQMLPIQKTEMVTSQIASFIHHVDTILTLRNEIVVNNMPAIISMCNDFGVTVFSSDLASVEQGAAIGISPKEHTQGIEAAHYLLMIFKENIRPSDIPVKELPIVNYVGINESTLGKQGVVISPQQLESIQNKVLYKKETP